MDTYESPTLRAAIHFAILELACFLGMVICWSVVLGVAEITTMAVVAVIRTLGMVVLWVMTVAPFRRWPLVEPSDHELLALDEQMTAASARYNQIFVGSVVVAMVVATGVDMLGIAEPAAIGAAELVCGALFLPAVMSSLAAFGFWLWAPFEPIRCALRTELHERSLVGGRGHALFLRSQLLRAALTSIAIFFGVAGLGGMAHVEGRRNTASVEQLRRAEAGALRVQLHGEPGDEDLELVDETRLTMPASSDDPTTRSQLEVAIGGTEARAAAAIGDGRWVLARAAADEQLGWFVLLTLIVGACFSVPLLGATLASAGAQLEQFSQLGKAVRALIETGKTRGVARIVPRNDAEVDALIDDFNALLDMLDELSDAATKVAKGDLRSSGLERPGDLHDAFRGMVEQLHTMVVQIRSTALDLASAAAEIHSITQEQELAVNHQSKRMREVSDTVASLASAANSITQTSAGVLANAEQTLRTTSATITRIAELSEQTKSISDLLDRIHEIADRSDLLALNGALEATRAGDAGRGFALVAAEMRRLAERVAQTVGEVRWRVTEIEASGTNTELVAEDSHGLAEQTADAARQISLVTERQSRETELAARTVQEITAVVISTAGATSQTRAAAEGLRVQAEQLERLTRQFALGQLGGGPSTGQVESTRVERNV